MIAIYFSFLQLFFLSFHQNSNDLIEEHQGINVVDENLTYFIDFKNGDDSKNGMTLSNAWGSFSPINNKVLPAGTTVKISGGGNVENSLILRGNGTSENPIKVEFEKGIYNFYPKNFYKEKFQISNTNDSPNKPKAVALYVVNSQHILIDGNSSEIILHGKSIETSIRYSNFITFQNLSFDYNRPTVSEITIKKVTDTYALAEVHQDSKYKIKDGELFWIGEDWVDQAADYWQIYDSVNKKVTRKYFPVGQLYFSQINDNKIKINFSKNPGFKANLIFQTRNVIRDCAGFFIERSSDVVLNNLNIYFMHGMGVVAQFSQDITYNLVKVAPRKGSGRTCAAWADILHFSGCRGQIKITNSLLSTANDDAINVHGTHLQLTGSNIHNELITKFIHPQTFGFSPFILKDSVAIINKKSLLPEKISTVENIRQIDPYTYAIQLKDSLSDTYLNGDYVIENSSWQPSVSVQNCVIKSVPTRGVLLTSAKKLLLENNIFSSINSSSILVADDAKSWYESGRVQSLLINQNKFLQCGSPLIKIHPENTIIVDEKVHKNIDIKYNIICPAPQKILELSSVENITFLLNTIYTDKVQNINNYIDQHDSKNLRIENNFIKISSCSN